MKTLIQACVVAFAISANAQGFVECIAEYSSQSGGGQAGTIGFTFKANAELTITDLGVFAYILTGSPVSVGLWNEAGQLLTSAEVSSSSELVNVTKYATLQSPVSLLPQQVYFVGGLFSPGTIMNFAGGDFLGSYVIPSWTEYLGYASAPGAALTKPTAQPGGEQVLPIAVNFRYMLVPEPSSAALVLLGGLALACRKRLQG